VKLESLLEYLDGYLGVAGHPDYPVALNGLQVDGPEEVTRVCAAVDASEAAIEETVRRGAQLLVVHHGLFWDGLRPVTGRRRRKLARLIEAGVALYSVHLPLDSHAEVGNCVLLARALGIEPAGRMGRYQGVDLGWWGETDLARGDLVRRAEAVLGGPVRAHGSGPERVRRVGVITGSGASFLEEAARMRLDTLVTGEGPHHAAIDATELGMNVLYGGHYATETFGVRALAAHISERFGLAQEFLDLPTGT
jgi:dinuclear metal center YbgI/SA1388 family protein